MRKMQQSYCSRAGGTKEKVLESMNENCFQSVQRKSRTCARIIWHHAMLARYRWDWRSTEGWHHPGTHGRQHVEFWRASECASGIIQQLASQNHRKLKSQTATFPVVAKWAFYLEKRCAWIIQNLCSMCLTVSRIHMYSSLLHGTLQT